jgi:integrase/recombinase XerD
MDKYFNSFREMISLRGLTDHTIKSYSTYIRAYLNYLTDILHKQPEDVSWDELRDYIQWIQYEKHLSDRTINAAISQLRFFTIYVLHKPWDSTQLPIRKFDTYLPYVPSMEDTFTFINTLPDLKQKAMVALMYSAGLRIGEVCHLRYEDIDRRHMRIHVSHGKSRNDRYAILSKTALSLLTEYWFAYNKPTGWLFPKQVKIDSEKPIDTFYLSRHIHEHERRLGWEERLTCHSFRHAFGTHLYENGTDLLTIKALLGHKSLNSTTIYVHLASNGVAGAVSPLDQLVGDFHG